MRMCKDCRTTVFSRSDFRATLTHKPPDQRAYENLIQFERGIRLMLPKFQRLLMVLQYVLPTSYERPTLSLLEIQIKLPRKPRSPTLPEHERGWSMLSANTMRQPVEFETCLQTHQRSKSCKKLSISKARISYKFICYHSKHFLRSSSTLRRTAQARQNVQ